MQQLIPLALLSLFSATFFGVWMMERARWHLLWFCLAFSAYAAALLCQISIPPSDQGINTVLSAMLYTTGTLLFGNGVLSRSGQRLHPRYQLLAFLAVVGSVGYFFYIDRNFLMRIYVLNLGLAAIFFLIGWRARFLLLGNLMDRALLATVVLVGLHFIPRTLLTAKTVSADTAAAFAQSQFWAWMEIALAVLGTAAGLCLLLIAGADVIYGLRRERNSDSMTGVLNRRGLETEMASRAPKRRHADRTCIVVCDVDHFKSINDQYGHATGDRVLKGIAKLITRTARRSDLVARIGGEEFVIVLRDCDADKAYALAERMRNNIETMHFEGLPAERPVTCSFGVAELQVDEPLWSVIDRADQSLYAAKRAGRNCTVAKGLKLAAVA